MGTQERAPRSPHPTYGCLSRPFAQASGTSAQPGTLNYVEGNAYLDGQPVDHSRLGHVSLDQNQTLSTNANGNAELLLTPGVFFRLGSNSEVRMVSNSLTNTQVELTHGEALVDVAMLFKDNNIRLIESNTSTKLLKKGLYRFNADDGQVAVYDGKVSVEQNDKSVEFGKGHQVLLANIPVKAQKLDTKQQDNLYAWSNLRSKYAAEASYASAKNVNVYNYGVGGWLWNPWYSSWAFMPWGGYTYGAFGWGFFSPAYIRYAPIYYSPWRPRVVPVTTGHVPTSAVVHGLAHGMPRQGVSTHLRPVAPMRPVPAPRVAIPMPARPMHR